MKRTPLKRSDKPMKRTELKRSAKPLKPVSDHRKEVNAERAKLQEAAWGPRPWTCVFNIWASSHYLNTGEVIDGGRCCGEVNGHEILWRGRAGSTDENLLDVVHQLPLCNGHNGWVDEHPLEAKRMGLAISAGEEESK
jgi:hypothetical protein